MWWGPSKILTNQNSAGARTGLWGNQVQKGQCAHRVMGKSSAKRSMRAQARTGLCGNQVQKGQCTHRRAHRVMGKSSAKRSMRAQARAQGYGEIKCKKVNARTGVRTGLWGNQVQKGQCVHRRAHRVMGKSSAKRSMRTQARTQGYGEIKCKKVNECTGVRTGLWGNQVQKGQ